jgi:hypothetical protein
LKIALERDLVALVIPPPAVDVLPTEEIRAAH